MEAFERFGEDQDKFRAIQLFEWLRDQYPHSSFAAQASSYVDRLSTAKDRAQAATATRPLSQGATVDSTIRAVRRETLPEVVRVTIELDREVPFYQERLDNPARLFFDLKGTRTVAALVDAAFRYDTDVVRHIRLGRHPNNTTRIVLDLENVGQYSVFTLYNPYRIVIDSERAMAVLRAVRERRRRTRCRVRHGNGRHLCPTHRTLRACPPRQHVSHPRPASHLNRTHHTFRTNRTRRTRRT